MDEILKQIHYYAQQLKGINMWQAAGDYDYISSFLDSPRWNDGEYYGVVPRGEETIDEYSHNCPIPFTANRCLVSRCYDNDKALEILNKLSEIFSTLKSDVSGDGLTAINAYIENTNRYIELLGGEPVPPGPEPPVYDTYYAGGIISPDASIDFVVTKPDKTFFTVDNISLTGFMIPTSVENTVYGNQTATSQNIVINNNDVDLILYDSNGEPITDQSKLYAIIQLNGTGTGNIPVVLPSVNTDAGYISFYPNHYPFGSGVTNTAYVWDYDTNRWILSSYDPTKTYAAIDWYAESSVSGTYGISLSGNAQSGVINITNILSYSIHNYIESRYAICDSTQVEVVPVINYSSILRNAFKYTDYSTDYYYVIDGEHTIWTDDLTKMGFKTVFPLDLIVGMSIDNSTGDLIAVTFDYPLNDNYWGTRVKSAVDKELLRNLSLWRDTDFKYGSVLNTSSYRYEIIEIYTGIGEGVVPFDLSDFYIPNYQTISLRCTGSYSTPVKSWKLRITPITQES